jgi:hypothetical protein
MRLGFDEVYVVAVNDTTLDCECLYDAKTADERVKELKNSGWNGAEKMTLEYAFENGYISS